MADAVNYNRYLLSLILSHASKDQRIVDFGSGIGTFAQELDKRGFRVHCIEPDAQQAAVIASTGLPVSTSLDEIEDGSVDYIYTLNVLEHIEDDSASLRRLRKKLKPGGILLIYVQILFSSMDRKVGHFRRYTRRSLTTLLREGNFHVLTDRYVDSIGFFASLLFRLIGNESGSLNHGALLFYDRIVFPISRICDYFLGAFFGKNVLALAKK